MERAPLSDPDDFNSYRAIRWEDWIVKINKFPALIEDYIECFNNQESARNPLLIPLDPKTYAGYCFPDQYIYKFICGWSWIPPYLAGIFALCRQVDENIDLEEFWNTAYSTGRRYEFQANGKTLSGRIIDPVKLIGEVEFQLLSGEPTRR